MFSGRYPFETGMIRNGLHMDPGNSGFVSLTRHFREQGYRTARVGKVFHMGIPGGIGEDGDDDAMAWDIAVNNTGWDAVPANHDKLIRYTETLNPGISVSYLDPDIADEEWADGAKGAMLYDLEKDPGEFSNLAALPEYSETVRDLQQQLKARMRVAGKER